MPCMSRSVKSATIYGKKKISKSNQQFDVLRMGVAVIDADGNALLSLRLLMLIYLIVSCLCIALILCISYLPVLGCLCHTKLFAVRYRIFLHSTASYRFLPHSTAFYRLGCPFPLVERQRSGKGAEKERLSVGDSWCGRGNSDVGDGWFLGLKKLFCESVWCFRQYCVILQFEF